MKLVLVRHGLTDWAEAGRFTGWSDVPLNATGRDQAVQLKERLAREPFASVWTSDLSRSVETSRLADQAATEDRRLRELHFGELEGQTWEELDQETRRRVLDFDGFEAPGGETVQELRTRVCDFLGGLDEGRHLVFTHGGVIRLLLRLTGRDEGVLPGSIVELDLLAAEMLLRDNR